MFFDTPSSNKLNIILWENDIHLIKVFLQVIQLNKSNSMWYFITTALIVVGAIIMLVPFGGRRKRILANRIPGPAGNFLFGSISLFIQGPEKSIEKMSKVYRM